MPDDKRGKEQSGLLNLRNNIDRAKIIEMEEKAISKTFISNKNMLSTVEQILSQGWRKEKGLNFYKERNTYKIKLDGVSHPIWSIVIEPKSDIFHIRDWKLKKDLRGLRHQIKPIERKLYLNDKDKEVLHAMLQVMLQKNMALIYNEYFMIFRSPSDEYKIFKIAATMNLVKQKDGWYIGQKRMI